MKKAMSFRLTEESSRLLKSLAESIGVSQTAIIEIAIREAAKQTAISEESKRLREALKTIGTECENYTAPHSCWTAGRIQNAEFGADSVCPHCIAARALAPKRSEK